MRHLPPHAGSICFRLRKFNGSVFAWFDTADRKPPCRLLVVSEEGWARTSTSFYRIRSHPQETGENAFDLNHLSFLHDFEEVRQAGKSELDGPQFRTKFRFEGQYNIPIMRNLRFDLTAAVDIWGLGFPLVETVAPSLGV